VAPRVVAFVVCLLSAGASVGLVACRGCEEGPSNAPPDAAPAAPANGDAAPRAIAPHAGDASIDASPSPSPAGLDAGAPRARAPGCSATSPAPTSFRGHVHRPEGERSYEARLPARIDPSKPARVVFALHPFGSTALEFMNATHFPEVFGPAGWVTISPDGVGRRFIAGACCGEASRAKLDDVGLLLAIVDDLRERACIDDERIYLAGFSNGGFLSQAFACAHADRVGAIASVGAVVGVRPCEPSEPVSALLVNGSGDDVIPIDGGGPFRTRPLAETLATWRDAGGCEERFGDAGITRSVVGATCRLQPCREGRTLESCIVPYAHVWMVKSHPAGDPPSARQTAREILDFFDGYGVRR
jgi:polyhydroxybutyrate depolymerase